IRARDPEVRQDQAKLADLIRTAPIKDAPVSLLLVLEMSLNPNTSAYRVDFLKRIQAEHPTDFYANHRLGFVLVKLRRPGEAVEYFKAAQALRPGTFLVHNNLGHALLEAGRDAEAIDQLQRAVVIDPTLESTHLALAQTLWKAGQHDEALKQLHTAI